MQQNRFSHLIIVFIVIALGLFSRKIEVIPLFVGDLLYAVMIYFGIRFLYISLPKTKSAIIALIICYSIELLQLYNANWMAALRNTFFGRYVLGQGFLWSDILAYSFGIILAYIAESVLFSKEK
ncbi:ribosomal maturation YjgA family protein [Flavobacterium soli]|uniref:ribosomal maturation YjgA family protein n=1 Tax=Flavobacterium soli TaxID=344881 RepID=UPI00040D04DE|nr:DUF2809 domain-containing protein [Flavobacterium soli]